MDAAVIVKILNDRLWISDRSVSERPNACIVVG